MQLLPQLLQRKLPQRKLPQMKLPQRKKQSNQLKSKPRRNGGAFFGSSFGKLNYNLTFYP
jgi:hypothetical protein